MGEKYNWRYTLLYIFSRAIPIEEALFKSALVLVTYTNKHKTIERNTNYLKDLICALNTDKWQGD